jgi:hypothetical protein
LILRGKPGINLNALASITSCQNRLLRPIFQAEFPFLHSPARVQQMTVMTGTFEPATATLSVLTPLPMNGARLGVMQF